jgi:hypothetical protein
MPYSAGKTQVTSNTPAMTSASSVERAKAAPDGVASEESGTVMSPAER